MYSAVIIVAAVDLSDKLIIMLAEKLDAEYKKQIIKIIAQMEDSILLQLQYRRFISLYYKDGYETII